MFFGFDNFDSILCCSISNIHSFKVFKRSTKFKRYNRGTTKFIMNRRKYILKKKVTSEVSKFLVPLPWTRFFRTKRQFIRFFQLSSILPLTLTLVNQKLAQSALEALISTRSFTSLLSLSVNTASLTKSLLCNKSLFVPQVMISFINFFNHTKYNVLLTSDLSVPISTSLIDKGALASYGKRLRGNTNSIWLAPGILYSSMKFKVFSFIMKIVLSVKILITKLILLNLFN